MFKYGRKKLTVIGMVVTTIGCLGFGSLIHIDNNAIFISMAIVTRVMQGIGNSMADTCCFGQIAFMFKNHP